MSDIVLKNWYFEDNLAALMLKVSRMQTVIFFGFYQQNYCFSVLSLDQLLFIAHNLRNTSLT